MEEEQYRKIGEATYAEGIAAGKINYTAIGRAAIEACAPILLGEPSEEEMREAACIDGRKMGYVVTPFRALFANRLRSLTAKPDAAVEEVKRVLNMQGGATSCEMDAVTDLAIRVVAATRKADKEAAK